MIRSQLTAQYTMGPTAFKDGIVIVRRANARVQRQWHGGKPGSARGSRACLQKRSIPVPDAPGQGLAREPRALPGFVILLNVMPLAFSGAVLDIPMLKSSLLGGQHCDRLFGGGHRRSEEH